MGDLGVGSVEAKEVHALTLNASAFFIDVSESRGYSGA
ncbi:MAG: hypothetical protein ACI8W8_002427 [Rhodothermales bacterium]|jgi:hypothetical protein